MLGYTADEVTGKHYPGLFLSCPDKIKREKKSGIKTPAKSPSFIPDTSTDVQAEDVKSKTFMYKDPSKKYAKGIYSLIILSESKLCKFLF